MLFHKKGDMTKTQLAIVIIAAILLVILLPFSLNTGEDVMTMGNDFVCKESIMAHSKVAGKVLDTALVCKAEHFELDEKKDNQYFFDMYRLLTRCWDKTLGQKNQLSEGYWKESDIALVCYSFTVEDELFGDDFAIYMSKVDPQTRGYEEKPRAEMIDSDWSSSDNSHYLIKIPVDNNEGDVTVEKMEKLEPEKTYLVIFNSYSTHGARNAIDLHGPFHFGYTDETAHWWTVSNHLRHTFIVAEDEWKNLELKNPVFFWDKDEKS